TLIHESLVEFATTVDSSEQVGFDGPGTIQVDDGFHFAGTIFHFTNPGEQVDIRNLSDANHDAHTSFNFLTNQLTVFGDNGSVTLQLDAENYSGVSWSAQQMRLAAPSSPRASRRARNMCSSRPASRSMSCRRATHPIRRRRRRVISTSSSSSTPP